MWRLPGLLVAGMMGLSGVASAGQAPPAGTAGIRTIYVTVTDENGAAVSDLAPADFVVKEGGKEREILKASPATGRMRLALMAEERLLGDGGIRNGLFDFMRRMQPFSEIAFIAIGIRNKTIVDYTSDINVLAAAINGLSLNPPPQSNLAEGILDIAKIFEKEHPARPVIVVVAISGGQSGGASSNEVLNQLRQSGAGMHTVTIAMHTGAGDPLGSLGDLSNREQVLGDGAKQSGGRRVEVAATISVPKGLQQIAADLSSQYIIQYALPEGIKKDRRLNVSVKRRGINLRAPSLIPDR